MKKCKEIFIMNYSLEKWFSDHVHIIVIWVFQYYGKKNKTNKQYIPIVHINGQ